MNNRLFRCLARFSLVLAFAGWIVLRFSIANELKETEQVGGASVLELSIQTLDRFMVAGKQGEAQRGASLLDMYESSPRKAEREIGDYYESRKEVFSEYVSISSDIYGYEYKENGYRGPNIEIEGGVETESGITAEFTARLVYRDLRWRIISVEID